MSLKVADSRSQNVKMVFFESQWVRIASSFESKSLLLGEDLLTPNYMTKDLVGFIFLHRKNYITIQVRYILPPKRKDKSFNYKTGCHAFKMFEQIILPNTIRVIFPKFNWNMLLYQQVYLAFHRISDSGLNFSHKYMTKQQNITTKITGKKSKSSCQSFSIIRSWFNNEYLLNGFTNATS